MIKAWKDLSLEIQKTIDIVFWETSFKKVFSNKMEKKSYYNNWLGYYLTYAPEYVFVYCDDKQIYSYIIGVSDGRDLLRFSIGWNLKSEALFFNFSHYSKYCAHFHINSMLSHQGQGIGSGLLLQFESKLTKNGIFGLHLVTSKGEPNNQFYLKNGYFPNGAQILGDKNLIFFCKDLC